VLAVGDIHPRKNIGALARAMALIGDPDLELALVGRPALGGEQIVRGARAHWLGRVDDPHLADLYRAAAVVAVPSLYEGFGLPVLEAMASGAPVVASNRGAMPEVEPATADRLRTAGVSQAAAFTDRAMGEAAWRALGRTMAA
jgi:glycosyltransferase involved in cell wall biosynthesis